MDFDGGVYHGSFTADPYDVDGNSATFNVEEQETIAEAWRQMSAYFAMFNVNVTTIAPSTPVAWLVVGNNVSGGQSYVNVFPNSRPESRNASSHARTRVSAIAHEIGHNFGNQHTANYDNLANKTAEYHSSFDPLHGPIMGLDYTGVIHKWTTWHNRNAANVLQDDMAVIAADLDNYGGDGYRLDDFAGTIATAAPLTAVGITQAKVGIIERLTDVNMFSFVSTGGTYSILVGRDNPSGVNVKLSVLDASNNVLASEDGNPRTVPYTMVNDSHMTLALPAGTFYVKVESHGNYGDQGQYIVRVDPLAAGWQAEDVGLNGVPGFSGYDAASGTYTVAGSGDDIGSTVDGFQYLYQTLDASGSITVRVDSIENTSSTAKAGIMFRESLADNARNVALVVTPSSGIQWSSRTSTGGSTSSSTVTGIVAPVWLRISRSGSTFSAYRSNDGVVWTPVGSPRAVSMPTTVYLGPVATSDNNLRLAAATFSSVSLTGAINSPLNLNALPPPVSVVATTVTSNSVTLDWSATNLPGDTNGDANVNLVDYYNVRDNFGGAGLGDANQDGAVDAVDFRLVKDHQGLSFQNYAIERSGDGINYVQVATTVPSVRTYTDGGLSDFQRYTYRVRVRNSFGYSEPSTVVVATTHAGAVTNLNVISYSTTQLIPDWTDASGEANYRVERSNDGVTGWIARTTLGKNVPTYNDTGMTANTRFYYRVVTLEAGGVIAATSAVVSAYTRLPTVTGLAFLSQAATQLKIGWNAVTGATSYRVERSLDGDSFSTIASNLTVTNLTDNSVSASTEYFYRVVGVNANTQSVPSSAISTTTPAASGAADLAAADAGAGADQPATDEAVPHMPGEDIIGTSGGAPAGIALQDRTTQGNDSGGADHASAMGLRVANQGSADGREGGGNDDASDRAARLKRAGAAAAAYAQSALKLSPSAVDEMVKQHDVDVRHQPRLSESLLYTIARSRPRTIARGIEPLLKSMLT